MASSADSAEVAATMKTIGLCLHPATSVWRARELFIWSRVSVLPVTVGAFLLGAITRADVDEALRPRGPSARRRAVRARARAAAA
jgi:CBS domain-containing protein